MEKKEFTLPLKDRTIHGFRYIPAGTRIHPLAILSHGFNGFETDFTNTALFLSEHGIEAAAWSFCGGGNRETRSGFSTDRMTLETETEELLALAGAARTWENVDASHIFFFGGSQGGMVSALAAARKPHWAAGLVLLFPAFCIPDDWRKKWADTPMPPTVDFWGVKLGKVFYDTAKDLQVFDIIGAYKGPVLILHGTDDRIVPIRYAQKASETYQNARLEIFEGEGHGFSPKGNKAVDDMLLSFIRSHLD